MIYKIFENLVKYGIIHISQGVSLLIIRIITSIAIFPAKIYVIVYII